jgi:hypothetical protein
MEVSLEGQGAIVNGLKLVVERCKRRDRKQEGRRRGL